MTANLRYDIESHREQVKGRIISSDLTFAIDVGDGKYSVTLAQDNGGTITVHGGTLPTLIAALTEVHDLYLQAVGRTSISIPDE